jgi:hypothetical protein
MERQNDSELRELLREWKAPDTPPSLEARVLKNRPRWWSVLLHGYIRVPVPVACCLALAIIGGAWRLATVNVNGCSNASLISPIAKRANPPAGVYKPEAATTCAADSTC